MKKTLILASVLVFMSSVVLASEMTKAVTNTPVSQSAVSEGQKPPRPENQFEKRLKLTEEQKQQAKEIRMKGHREIKPVMEQMKLKHEEIEAVKRSKLTEQEQAAKIVALKNEMHELHKKAHDIRMANMKEFETILTKKQLKELKKMKEEGRKKFEKEHKNNPRPFGAPPEFGRGPKAEL